MAAFKVGQRVRIVKGPASVQEGVVAAVGSAPAGYPEYHIEVSAPRCPPDRPGKPWFCSAAQLEPLTDPRADEFIADMERFARVTRREPVSV